MHIYFAPLEGITTYPYRNLHHKYFGGVEKYFTPFLAPGPEQGMSVKEMRDVLPENNAGIPVVPQILTNRAGDFLLASKKLSEMGYREINLNLGCPSGTVTAKKKGSGFLLYPDDLDRFFDEVFSNAAVRNGEFLVSVKTRIGKNEVEEWPELMQVYNRYPIHELTVHPRIQKEFYKGTPHLDVFADILKESRNPVVYNGDLFTVENAKEFREKFPTVGTVMIGRGLIRNPALAEMILQEETEPEANILPRIREFHDALFEHYRETMSGDRNLLFRMKDLWSYMLAEVPDSEKLAKKIRKSQHVPEYLAAVEEVFARWDANR
ncbi:tRNA-dihydrouridine synthase family protein [Clostridium sp. AF37-5AT]|nr:MULTISPECIES: tRNA-dihydrouridine synthase family protein [unclassified Clostridium]RHO02738.1 tRNA-dihydrouridine synthase family protein [Clostridium sp. AM22-16AC]RHO96819.1 tRNA-dihydrouridine synthase family protein [Clostridium sp. AF37-5AT]